MVRISKDLLKKYYSVLMLCLISFTATFIIGTFIHEIGHASEGKLLNIEIIEFSLNPFNPHVTFNENDPNYTEENMFIIAISGGFPSSIILLTGYIISIMRPIFISEHKNFATEIGLLSSSLIQFFNGIVETFYRYLYLIYPNEITSVCTITVLIISFIYALFRWRNIRELNKN